MLNNLDLNGLEKKLNMLLDMSNKINNIHKFQLLIDTRKLSHSRSIYRFDLSREVNNVSQIELMNYSLPKNYYNITNNNNTIEYYTGDDIDSLEKKIYKLENGLYNIDKLLEVLNNNTELVFSVGFDQKVIISSDNNFKLGKGELLESNLGFVINTKEYEKSFMASHIWDLRGDDYFLLYIDNVDPDSPLALLNFENKSFGKIEFNIPQSLSHLDIRIVDKDNKPIDFNGRYHSLILMLETRD